MQFLISMAVLAGFSITSALAEKTPAKPIEKPSPSYPHECETDLSENDVYIVYDISEGGITENIRILQSSNSCFENAAQSAVRKWRFSPQLIDGRPTSQTDNTTRITFITPKRPTSEVEAMFAEMLASIYPDKCQADAKHVERVTLKYDISKKGVTKNIKVVQSTNDCFNKTAIEAIKGWRYEPRVANGQAVERTNVKVTLTFKLDDAD